ncbi:hypothetical protein ACWD04_27990 [Streptomyces sp. NPDC002911]
MIKSPLVYLVERTGGLGKEWCPAVDGIRRGDRSQLDRCPVPRSGLG